MGLAMLGALLIVSVSAFAFRNRKALLVTISASPITPQVALRVSRPIAQFCHALLLRTMITAVHHPVFLQTVTYDPHTAMSASRRKLVDCALEAIESIGLICSDYLK
jgi:hypothetical protein